MRQYLAYLFPVAVVGLIVLLAHYQSAHQAYQPIDSDLYNRCPPGNACLAPHWVVNRLNHDITVIWDGTKERWVMDRKPHDPNGIVVKAGEVAYYQMQLVMPTPAGPPASLEPTPIVTGNYDILKWTPTRSDPNHVTVTVRSHAGTGNPTP